MRGNWEKSKTVFIWFLIWLTKLYKDDNIHKSTTIYVHISKDILNNDLKDNIFKSEDFL